MDSFDSPLAAQGNGASSVIRFKPLSQVDKLRLWRHDAYMQHHYSTAEHIGDKILAMTKDPNDAFWLAQVHFSSGSYVRAKQLLQSDKAYESNIPCRYLCALSLTRMNKWEEALDVIGERGAIESDNYSNHNDGNSNGNAKGKQRASNSHSNGGSSSTDTSGGIKLEASISYLRGQIYTAQNNFDRAKECYQEAVKIDAKCYEAFDQLIRNNLMAPKEEWKFLTSLDFDRSCGENAELTKALYTIRLGKYTNLKGYREAESVLKDDYGLGSNGDVLLSRADMLFVQCRFKDCLELCEKILEDDTFKFSALPDYLACLHELGGRNKLFLTAHEMADNHPNEPVTWLAVGVYYLTIGKVAEARRYFSKASMMNPYFGQAWIGFAHTFAVEGEHEQAISAYSTAARLFQGTHLPSLFLGMQHLHLNNLTLAEEYLYTSYSICKTDPLLLNEMGVVYYHKTELTTAESYFHEALKAASELDSDPRAWLSINANLGHVYRRMEKHDMALSYFEEILKVSPQDANIHSAMGLVNLQAGRVLSAIENFHEALSISPNDPVASDLLNRALEEHSRMGITVNTFDESVFEDSEFNDIIGPPSSSPAGPSATNKNNNTATTPRHRTPGRNTQKKIINTPASPEMYYDNDDSQMEIESD